MDLSAAQPAISERTGAANTEERECLIADLSVTVLHTSHSHPRPGWTDKEGLTWRLQQVRVDGGCLGQAGGRGQAGQLVDGGGRAGAGRAPASHVGAEIKW